MNKTSPIMMWN